MQQDSVSVGKNHLVFAQLIQYLPLAFCFVLSEPLFFIFLPYSRIASVFSTLFLIIAVVFIVSIFLKKKLISDAAFTALFTLIMDIGFLLCLSLPAMVFVFGYFSQNIIYSAQLMNFFLFVLSTIILTINFVVLKKVSDSKTQLRLLLLFGLVLGLSLSAVLFSVVEIEMLFAIFFCSLFAPLLSFITTKTEKIS
jgi:hypothetical protein